MIPRRGFRSTRVPSKMLLNCSGSGDRSNTEVSVPDQEGLPEGAGTPRRSKRMGTLSRGGLNPAPAAHSVLAHADRDLPPRAERPCRELQLDRDGDLPAHAVQGEVAGDEDLAVRGGDPAAGGRGLGGGGGVGGGLAPEGGAPAGGG